MSGGEHRRFLVGLTGGIGAGKTTVARMLREHGAFVVDADQVAREVVAPGSPGLARLVGRFGKPILGPDGALDRAALGRIAFADDRARVDLNAITHPLIRERTAQIIAATPPGSIVMHDVPLLAELDLAGAYDMIIVVDCTDDVRLARLAQRGMPRAEALSRMSAQASRETRLAIADLVIDNSGSEADLARQVSVAWDAVLAKAKAAGR